ncbi:MAG: cupin domain-containing protein [Algicola sp.]|nr:cupin domain-containing protein [Algicola sp.]
MKFNHNYRFNCRKFCGCFGLFLLLLNCNNKPNLPDPLEAGWQGQPVAEVLEENDEIRVLRCTFPPGIGHEKHYHDPHVGYTVTGSTFRITDSTGTREVDVPSGYTFSKEALSIHEVLNIGDKTAVFIIIEYK